MSMNHIRRCILSDSEKRTIAMSQMPTRELAKVFNVSPCTIRVHRKKSPLETLTEKHGYGDHAPSIKSLIDAYEDGRFARRKWGKTAVCHYKGEHAEAWRLGYGSN